VTRVGKGWITCRDGGFGLRMREIREERKRLREVSCEIEGFARVLINQ